MKWGVREFGGTAYSLAHLNPFGLKIVAASDDAPDVHVRVTFGCHTFTRSVEVGDPDDLLLTHGGEVRTFCPIRYSLSFALRDAVT